MNHKVMILAAFAMLTGALIASSVETTAEFALDNVLASKVVRSGETVPVIRDALWGENGVTFSMTGVPDEELTEGVLTSLLLPDVGHYKLLHLGLRISDTESYAYTYLVLNGEPNVLADAIAEFPLDSRTGILRKAKARELITYSDQWSGDGTAASIAILDPDGGESTQTLPGEGLYAWDVMPPYVPRRLKPGIYTFTCNTGSESLTARFRVTASGLQVIIR